ncbi:MAG: hypothetical protein AB1423_04075 [Pseudomonadota bacterium]
MAKFKPADDWPDVIGWQQYFFHNPQPATRNPQPATRNPQLATRITRITRNP